MSSSGAGRREVAYRLFAAEYDDATVSYQESDEERAPNYVVSPTGGRVNRLFLVGVLTEVEPVSEEMLRARIADPSGVFVAYAGQYQPDALAFLEGAEPPMFLAMTGKARTFQPEDGERVFTSVRPESINEVTADTRDRWVVRTAEATLDRVATVAAAKRTGLDGEALREALESDGVEAGQAHGTALALAHYGTTAAYLRAVGRLALDATRVVAGEREEVRPLSLAPGEGDDDELDALAEDFGGRSSPGEAPTPGPHSYSGPASEAESGPATEAESGPATEAEIGRKPGEEAQGQGEEAQGQSEEAQGVGGEARSPGVSDQVEGTGASGPGQAEPGEPEPGQAEPGQAEPGQTEPGQTEPGQTEPDEFELDEETRQRVEEEHGVEFETGTEVGDPGEATVGSAGAETEPEPEGMAGESQPVEPEGAADASDASDASEVSEASEASERPQGSESVDLESALVETMDELSNDTAADREELVATIIEEYGVSEADVDAAIQDALMSGRCYEPDEGKLRPI